jgi:MarR-like DNA-binding transcriptional regulator SgrR of sgrS sRNA
LRIPYYRPLDPLHPGFLPGRAERRHILLISEFCATKISMKIT